MQQDLPQKEPTDAHPSLYRAAGAPPERASSSSALPLSTDEQPRAAGAPLERATFLPLPSSPAQRELTQKGSPPYLNRAAPRNGRSLRKSLLLPSNRQPRTRRGSSRPRNSLLVLAPSNGQPRAAGALLERVASSLPQSSSPAQREIPKKL